MPGEVVCATCKFLDIPSKTCRVYPPSEGGRRTDSEFGGWPSVRLDDWCGQWAVAKATTVRLVPGKPKHNPPPPPPRATQVRLVPRTPRHN